MGIFDEISITTTPDDKMGGDSDQYSKTGINPSEDTSNKDSKEDNTNYPLLTLHCKLKITMDRVLDLLEVNRGHNAYLYDKVNGKDILEVRVMQIMDGSAILMGTGYVDRERFKKLDSMMLKPKLYLEKGRPLKLNSGALINLAKFNPIIAKESSEESYEIKVKVNNDLKEDKFIKKDLKPKEVKITKEMLDIFGNDSELVMEDIMPNLYWDE